MPLKHVSKANLQPTDLSVNAANNLPIELSGRVRLSFSIDGIKLSEEFLVSDQLEECLLSYQFLVRNKCVWDFYQGIVSFGQKQIRVCHRPPVMHARRVYVAETTVVPKKTQANLPIKLSYNNLKAPSRDLLIESKIICDGGSLWQIA
jgi:hypothetical protein